MNFSCSEYLSSVLPSLLKASPSPPPPPELVIQFIVRDEQTTRYAYRFSEDDLEVHPGVSDQVDLTLSFFADDLLSFSSHQFDVADALRTKRIRVHGDDEILHWLTRRLAP